MSPKKKKKALKKKSKAVKKKKKAAPKRKAKVVKKKKVMKKAKKAKKMKAAKKSAPRASAKKATVAKKAAAATAEKLLGKVVHYYDRIGVAIVELDAPIRLGDIVRIKSGTKEFLQPVTSLQIEHTPVNDAKRKDVVGLKVMEEAKQGAKVLPVD